ncbi:hypothetical protein OG496_01285 [Streptomyces sp. NBC_00988]|uniref:hypothetical protein n=1 Tax=Streptomyces sp. NBC_00988 TaxID=2903704 RepID=UPI0038687905|nr:hypothetical protein OG496_01285 [Streptomyces sp. NBC_00988]
MSNSTTALFVGDATKPRRIPAAMVPPTPHPDSERCGQPNRSSESCGSVGHNALTLPVLTAADVLHVHVGIYHVMYEINDQQIRVGVIHLRRVL